MTPFEWITLGLAVLSFLVGGGTTVLTGLLGILYGLARVRDRETQDRIHRLAGRTDLLNTHVVQLQEQVKPIDGMAKTIAGLDDKIDKLALNVEALKPRRR